MELQYAALVYNKMSVASSIHAKVFIFSKASYVCIGTPFSNLIVIKKSCTIVAKFDFVALHVKLEFILA